MRRVLIITFLFQNIACDGCQSAGDVAAEFGSFNPLFDNAGIVNANGRVLDPSRSVGKVFEIETILPVDPNTVTEDSFAAYLTVAGNRPLVQSTIPDAPPPPIEPSPGDPDSTRIDVPIRRVRSISRDGSTQRIRAHLDRRTIAEHPGHDLYVEVNPAQWSILANLDDEVFLTAMRFRFRIAATPPDRDPPYLADVSAIATEPLDRWIVFPELGEFLGADPVVATHSPIRFTFSEPMAAITPLVSPQDLLGFQPRADAEFDGGPSQLVSQTDSGLAPNTEYCVSFIPPEVAALGPLSWGSQDVSGEPLVPAFRSARARRRARGNGQGADVCFRTGPARIERPRPGEELPLFNRTLDLAFFNACLDGTCETNDTYRVLAREHDGIDDDLPFDWIELGEFSQTDFNVEITPTNGLEQAGVLIPGEIVAVDLDIFPAPGLCEAFGGAACAVDIRVDVCPGGGIDCILGDVIPGVFDFSPPPDVEEQDVTIRDTDTNDEIIDQICVVLREPEVGERVAVRVPRGDGTFATVRFGADDDNVTDEVLPNGDIRRCVTAIPVPPNLGSIPIDIARTDPSGNSGDGVTATAECQAPPRKFVTDGGRRSAFAIDRTGVPHVVYTFGEGRTGSEIRHTFWDPSRDEWVEEIVDCLCGRDPGTNRCSNCRFAPGYEFGWKVDLTFNAANEAVMCWTDTFFDGGDAPTPPPLGWELDQAASVHVAIRDASGSFHRSTVIDRTMSGGARNVGCAIEARQSRERERFDYLLVHGAPNLGTEGRVTLRYLRDDAMGTLSDRSFGGTAAILLPTASPGHFDVALDESDRFWVATRGNQVWGEQPDGLLSDPEVVTIVGGAGLINPRLAARGNGEIAVVATDGLNRLVYAYRPGTETEIAQRVVAPSDATISSYPPDASSSIAGEDATPNLFNNGGLASADGLYGGIPSSVTFSADEPDGPVIAWAAGRPNGMQYDALMLARPGQEDGQFDFETIDGVVMMSGAVHATTDAVGRARVVYHNGLGANRPDTSVLSAVREFFGVLHYYREEDEDEIFRREDHPRRGALRCFAERLFVHDQRDDRRAANAALDQFSADLRVQPALDFDPCGRTTDPGLAEELGYSFLTVNPGSRRPISRPRSRYARLPGESPLEFAVRTNELRRQGFARLRDALGSMSAAFDDILPHPTLMWDQFDPDSAEDPATPLDPTTDLFLDDGSGRAGLLDAVFLSLGEMLDDFCGQRNNPALCGPSTLDRASFRCEMPGLFQRNPSPYFRGRFNTEVIPANQFNGYVSPVQPGEDFSSYLSFRDTFSAGHDSEDEINEAELSTQDSRGILGAALRGLSFSEDGLRRRVDHVCTPLESDIPQSPSPFLYRAEDVCRFGVDALPETFPMDGVRVLPAARVGLEPSIGQASGLCPPFRAAAMPLGIGAVFKPPQQLVQIGGTNFGCCSGYRPLTCDTNLDCPDPDPGSGSIGGFRECVNGTCTTNESVPLCIPDVCVGSATTYCDDTRPEAPPFWSGVTPPICGEIPASCDEDIAPGDIAGCATCTGAPDTSTCEAVVECREDLRDLSIDGTVRTTPRDLLAIVRANGCSPGARCETNEIVSNRPPLARPLLGHWGIAVVSQFAGGALQQIGATASGLIGFGDGEGGAVEFDERISEVRTNWRGRSDGGLTLQGYYEIVIRLDNPSIEGTWAFGAEVIDVERARFVARIQPYYAPRNHPTTAFCDSCRRRIPDQDLHFAVVQAGVFFDSDSVERAPIVTGCGCSSRVTNCGLRNCADETIGGIPLEDVNDVEPALSADLTQDLEGQLDNLDELFYRLTADPIVGGIVFGRDLSVRALADAPECPIASTPDPGTRNCQASGGTGANPRRIRDADSIELLRIVDSFAEPVGRDNPP